MATAPEQGPEGNASSDKAPMTTNIFGDEANIHAPVAGRDLNIPTNIWEGLIASNLDNEGMIQSSHAGRDVFINMDHHHHPSPSSQSSLLEDVCRCLRTMLEAKYRKIKIPKIPWIDYSQDLRLEHYYVNLTLIQKYDFLQRVNDKEVQLQDIFKPNESRRPTRILVEGPEGSGKSVLALKLCYDYFKREPYLNDFELVILICLRDYKSEYLHNMLVRKLPLYEYNSETIFEAVRKHQKSVLILLDGYDESDVTTRRNLNIVLKSEYLPESTVVVTSRPSVVSSLEDFDRMIEIKGVNETKTYEFLLLHFESCSEEQKIFLREDMYTYFNVSFGDESLCTLSDRGLKTHYSKENENLFASPLFLLLVVVVIQNSYPNVPSFRTRTDLYKTLLKFVVQRTLREKLGSEQNVDLFEFNSENPPNYARSLSQFGKLALDKLKAKEFVFTKEEVTSHCDDDFVLHMGLLTENDYSDINQQETFSFQRIPRSILEFCAAFHLCYSFKCCPSTFTFPNNFLPDLSGSTETFVFPFFVGLCGNMLPFFFQPHMFIQVPIARLVNCEALITESTLGITSLSQCLSTLIPTILCTSYLNNKEYTTSELFKMTIAKALWSHKVTCIILDSVLDWDICLGKKNICVPMIIIENDYNNHCLRNIHAFEIRVFLEYFKNKDRLIDLAKSAKSSVVSLVKPPNCSESLLLSLCDSLLNCEVFVLNESDELELRVAQAKGEGIKAVGEIVWRNCAIYKTKIVEIATAGDEPSIARNGVGIKKVRTITKINSNDNMNDFD